jgi:hypothetical protein
MKQTKIGQPEKARFGDITQAVRSSIEFMNEGNRTDGIYGEAPTGSYDRNTGKIFFANESWFTGSFYSQPLTNYLVGFRDPNNIEATLNFLAPQVPVPGRLFEFKAAVNSEEFLSEVYDDVRAPYGDFKKVLYTGTDQTAKTLNRGLMTIVDLDRIGTTVNGSMGGAGPAPWQTNIVAKLTRRLYRNSVRRALSALSASAVTATTRHWVAQPPNPDVVPINPDLDVQQELLNATNVSGIRPNRVIYGDSAFLYRNQAYGAQNNPAGFLGYAPGLSANGMSAQEAAIATNLGVDRVLVSRERYQNASALNTTTTANKAEILGGNVYAFYAQDDVDTEDPSNIKRFVSTFNEEQGGGLFRVYVQQLTAKLVAVSVEFYEIIVVTYAGGIRKIPVVNV